MAINFQPDNNKTVATPAKKAGDSNYKTQMKTALAKVQGMKMEKGGGYNLAGYSPYTGSYGTEYNAAMGRAKTERNALDKQLGTMRTADEKALGQQRDYQTGQLAKSLGSAQKSNYGSYMNQRKALPNQMRVMGITGGAAENAGAQLGQAYQKSRAAAQSSHDSSYADTMNQWQTNMNDIASRYGEMNYNNMQNMYTNANTNAWNAYNSRLSRDSDMWNRANTMQQQRQQQANANRAYMQSRDQWAQNQAVQQQQVDMQKEELALRRLAAGK